MRRSPTPDEWDRLHAECRAYALGLASRSRLAHEARMARLGLTGASPRLAAAVEAGMRRAIQPALQRDTQADFDHARDDGDWGAE